MTDHLEKGLAAEPDSGSDGKGHVQQLDDIKPQVSLKPTRTFQAPEFIRKWSPEQRLETEKRLVRKIDLRLLPMIILMYILNYIDRVSARHAAQRGVVSAADGPS